MITKLCEIADGTPDPAGETGCNVEPGFGACGGSLEKSSPSENLDLESRRRLNKLTPHGTISCEHESFPVTQDIAAIGRLESFRQVRGPGDAEPASCLRSKTQTVPSHPPLASRGQGTPAFPRVVGSLGCGEATPETERGSNDKDVTGTGRGWRALQGSYAQWAPCATPIGIR